MCLYYTNINFFGTDAKFYVSNGGFVKLHMPPYSAMVIKNVPISVITI
jgi:hypothetical protein